MPVCVRARDFLIAICLSVHIFLLFYIIYVRDYVVGVCLCLP